MLDKVLDYLGRLVPYDTANVMLLEATDRLVLRAARGYERWTTEPVLNTVLDPEEHPLLWAQLVSQQSRIVEDTREQQEWQPTALNAHVRSWLAVPLLAGLKLVGIYSLESAEPGFFTTAHREVAESFAAHAAVAIQNAALYQEVKVARQRLQVVSRRLVQVQEAERRAIARELHDEIGQVLTGLKLTLEPLPHLSETEQSARLGRAAALLNEVIGQVRQMSLDLRPAMLDDLGLLPALLWHFDRYHEQTGTRVQFAHAGLGERLPSEVATAAYRIVQEALTNVARHAHVKDVRVSVRVTDGALHLLVEDQGQGFTLPDGSAGAHSSGLAGMRERAALLGGALQTASSPGAGTRITAWLPTAHSVNEPLASA